MPSRRWISFAPPTARNYPKFLGANGCDEVFVFLDQPRFRAKFSLTYNVCFKRVTNFIEEAHELVDDVNAFVASVAAT